MIARILAALWLCAIPHLALAQGQPLAEDLADTSDRGFIASLLEDALGGDGRQVRINGFAGALSRTATIQQITISDEAGIWLRMSDLTLDWNRSALLRGRIDINTLTASKIELLRGPNPPEGALPAPEAAGFSLPTLPVSIDVEKLAIDVIALGAPILGEQVEMRLDAAGRLADGSGNVSLTATRLGGQEGRFIIDASYDSAVEAAVISLDLAEAADGIVARSLDLSGRPALALKVEGQGPLDDLVTDITLDTGGARRFGGQVILRGAGAEGRAFEVDLSGDLAPLFPSDYARFFAGTTVLAAEGMSKTAGGLELSTLDLRTGAAQLRGAVDLGADNLPTRIALTGRIEDEARGAVTLPIPGGETQIGQASLQINYDEAQSDEVTAVIGAQGLQTAGADAERLVLSVKAALGDGGFAQNTSLTGRARFEAQDLAFDNAPLSEAIGAQIKGAFNFDYAQGGALKIDEITLDGSEYGATGKAVIGGLSDSFESNFEAQLRADDLARFSGLAGLSLTGRSAVALAGTADLGGAFDIRLNGAANDLGVGMAQADAALAGRTELSIAVQRSTRGTNVPRLELKNDQLRLTADAQLRTDASVAQFDLALADSSVIDPNLQGAVTLRGRATQDAEGWRVETNGTGPFDAKTKVQGRVTGPAPDIAFDVGLPDIRPIVPSYSGAAALQGTASLNGAAWQLNTALQGPYGLNGSVKGTVTGVAPKIAFDLALPDISPLVPAYRGAATVQGTASQSGDVWNVAANLQGPYGLRAAINGPVTGPAARAVFEASVPDVAPLGAGISGSLAVSGSAAQQGGAWRLETSVRGLSGADAQVSGLVRNGGTLDIRAVGALPLGLVNPFIAPRSLLGRASFDLAVTGPPNLSSVSGSISSQGGSLSAPNLQLSLQNIAAQIGLSRGRALLDVAADVSSGGRVSARGPIVLTGSLAADLAVALTGVRLVDPLLYDTVLDGALSLRGPLTGGAQIAGQVNVGETNILVPATGAGGFTIVPEIVHIGASQAVKTTLRRAGLDAASKSASSGAGGSSFGLDIAVNAPSRIFVRGRGIDAELGGALTLRGRTDALISAGRFNLVRGRLEILGKRFDLDEGSIVLQGSLDPFLRFVATTQTQAGSASVIIEGPASEPQVRFVSTPEAPEDEVLAQIFFGRGVEQLSAFQALQLASAVATLAGSGGEGIVTKLRRGFGLDDFDVTTDAEGNTGLRVGKYISDNVYTDVTIGDTNEAGVSINIDLTPNLTARGQVKQDGDSSIGIYFEKDY